jgi:hypothetical protein
MRLVLLLLSLVMTNAAMAAPCAPAKEYHDAVVAHHGKWIELTREQWQFARGVYVMNPQTPPGLPYGNRAVIAYVENDPGGLIFFIDGDKACSPMPLAKELRALLMDVGEGKVTHEGVDN